MSVSTACLCQQLKRVTVQVHRLDEATGGLLLVAKTRLGLQGLSASFEQRQVRCWDTIGKCSTPVSGRLVWFMTLLVLQIELRCALVEIAAQVTLRCA